MALDVLRVSRGCGWTCAWRGPEDWYPRPHTGDCYQQNLGAAMPAARPTLCAVIWDQSSEFPAVDLVMEHIPTVPSSNLTRATDHPPPVARPPPPQLQALRRGSD